MELRDPLDIFFPGSRIGVLLIHGLTGTPVEMKFIAKRLNRYGFTVLCPRLAGHCGAESEILATHWPDWTASVAEAYQWLSKHCDVIFAGGLSAGAVLSLYLAEQEKDVRGLSLYSTTLRWDGWSITRMAVFLPLYLRIPFYGTRYRFKETNPYGLKNERIRGMILKQMESGNAEAAGFSGYPGVCLRELYRMADVVLPKLAELDTPTLLVHAKEDDIAAVGNSLDIRKRLHGYTRLFILRDSYHMITVDQERDLVADVSALHFSDQLKDEEKQELSSAAKMPLPLPEETWARGDSTPSKCTIPRPWLNPFGTH